VGDLCDCLNVWDIVPRISDALDEDSLGLGVDGLLQVLGPVTLDKLGVDSEPGHEDFELVVASAVQVARADDVVSCVSQRSEGHELGGLSCQRGARGRAGVNTWPDEAATAATPPSRAAIRFSKTSTVG
jgi:hypothetical protein